MALKTKIIVNDHRNMADLMISEDEALTLRPYRDSVGKITVGFGRNLEDKGISYAVAELMKAEDIQEADAVLHERLTTSYERLSAVRKAVLISMYHNLGLAGLFGFKNMLAALRADDYERVFNEMLASKWHAQVGIRAKRLALVMRFDKYFSKPEAQSWFKNG